MAAKYSADNGKTRVLPVQTSAVTEDESELVEVFTADPSSSSPLYRSKKVLMTEREARELDLRPKWIPVLGKCSVDCGGSKYLIRTKIGIKRFVKFEIETRGLFNSLDERELRLSGARAPGGDSSMRRLREAGDGPDFLQR